MNLRLTYTKGGGGRAGSGVGCWQPHPLTHSEFEINYIMVTANRHKKIKLRDYDVWLLRGRRRGVVVFYHERPSPSITQRGSHDMPTEASHVFSSNT